MKLDMSHALPDEVAGAVAEALADWESQDKVRRLWERDASLWTGGDEADWLGWLTIGQDQESHLTALQAFAAEVESGGFSDALLLGMGGSSLCPEVLSAVFGKQPLHPQLYVLDSTDPAQIRSVSRRVDLSRTLFFVASKSGTTLEPNTLLEFFFDRLEHMVGPESERRFVAITDPGSRLEDLAGEHGFLHVFHGVPDIGGRFSALSHFGLVPAAAMGLDLARLLDGAADMAEACGSETAADQNPGLVLGAILGVSQRVGRDKVTLVASPRIERLGAWLEQLLAESTGKQGKALIPVDGEPLISAESYGSDRLFVYLRLESEADEEQDAAVDRIEAAGQPVVRIGLSEAYDLGGEFFRWEFATAVAGSIMGIDPFNQPDVEASKIATRRLTSELQAQGSLPAETPFRSGDGLRWFADDAYAAALQEAVGGEGTAAELVRAHLDRLEPGEYFALLAYLEMNDAHWDELQVIRQQVLERKRVATTVGFGPRFLHSTGQAYKGGPDTGVFLQITCDDDEDLMIPGRGYTFGVIKAAQARGDFEVLAERGRRALRVHLGSDVLAGLRHLRELFARALD